MLWERGASEHAGSALSGRRGRNADGLVGVWIAWRSHLAADLPGRSIGERFGPMAGVGCGWQVGALRAHRKGWGRLDVHFTS